MVGDPTKEQRIYQTIPVKGAKGDTFVLAGWAKGDSAPLRDNRQFAIIGTFNYTDGTTSESFIAQFNPDTDSSVSWQYSAQVMVAAKAYSSIKVEVAYDYNVNTVYFDGIQLFKEPFGSSYTYDEDGNVTSVVDLQKQTTTYKYDTDGNLSQVLQDNKAKMTYEYDDYHNVIKATTGAGVVYEFTYDAYGNNTSVSISNGTTKITSTATYSENGNILLSTKDALAKVTQYSYNVNTNVLEWVKYPEDTNSTRTYYTYDTMYRMTRALTVTDTGTTQKATYTYENDLLSTLRSGTYTTYTFTYGDFSQISKINIGSAVLATYTYTDDQNRYLQQLTYGNGDFVQYSYDSYGRLICETYEDGDTVTYTYDNTGALATVIDSDTGIKTTYYYDFTDRLTKYVETDGTNTHIVGYEFDSLNNVTGISETINGDTRTTTYEYDTDNRVTKVTNGGTDRVYTYDAYGRVSSYVALYNDATLLTQTYDFAEVNGNPTGQVEQVIYEGAGLNRTYTYTYDGNGNILSISDGTNTTTYVYDSSNQLIRENNQAGGFTHTWTYNECGNILNRSEYAYTTGELGTVLDSVDYTYYTGTWRDVLTSYDGNNISHAGIGNLQSDRLWTYTWEHGRELSSMTWRGASIPGYKTETEGETKNGLYLDSDGEVRYYVDGEAVYAGLVYWEGYYYYINSSKKAVRSVTYTTSTTNGLLPIAAYTFDEYGRMTNPPDGSYGRLAGTEDVTITYQYDANGMRTGKTVTRTDKTTGTQTVHAYAYIYNGSQLSQMTVDGHTLRFSYDSGKPMFVKYDGVTYQYILNLQGDVIGIMNHAGTVVVEYVYDAWGNLLSVTGSHASTVGRYNPLRYRSYVWDQETGLYYLQSRYYNPEWGRFINADAFTSTGQDILGNNMFAYCGNNPVINIDIGGTSYCVVGAGIQFDFSVGCCSVGIEIICYWDVDECADGGVVIAAYAYGGYSVDMTDPLLASILATVTDNTDLLLGGKESNIIALAALIGDTFSFSVSGVLITATEDFTTTESYQGSFTSMYGNIGKLKGSYAYSENCNAYTLGANLVSGPDICSWGVSKTYYEQFFEITLFDAAESNCLLAKGGGGACGSYGGTFSYVSLLR